MSIADLVEGRRDPEEVEAIICANCEGVVRPVTRSGRKASYRGETYDVPADVAIPTCVSCGAEWENAELAARLDAIFEEARLERERLRVDADDGECSKCGALWDESRPICVCGTPYAVVHVCANCKAPCPVGEMYCSESCLNQATIGPNTKVNGTSATLDAIAAAELAEIYARGSR